MLQWQAGFPGSRPRGEILVKVEKQAWEGEEDRQGHECQATSLEG